MLPATRPPNQLEEQGLADWKRVFAPAKETVEPE
jgi:hypothetical protein